MIQSIRIAETPFDPEAELAAFRATLSESGGLVAFQGLVRGGDEGDPVETLTLQHYPGMTESGIGTAIAEVNRRWPTEAVLVIHRVGAMRPGDPVVLVAAASRHRRAAFESADFLMDFLKSRAMFWKYETRDGERHWIEPRKQDYDDAGRWDVSPHDRG